MDQITHTETTHLVDGKEVIVYEYKKELSANEGVKLSAFLSKVEEGLKTEEGMEDVLAICKQWNKEVIQ